MGHASHVGIVCVAVSTCKTLLRGGVSHAIGQIAHVSQQSEHEPERAPPALSNSELGLKLERLSECLVKVTAVMVHCFLVACIQSHNLIIDRD